MPDLQSVAVLDDDADVRASLHFMLEAEGYRVTTCASPGELLERSDLHGFAGFVIDYQMPKLNGVEVLRALRHRGVTAPALLITGRQDRAVAEHAARAGISRVLRKPDMEGALLAELRAELGPQPAAP